MVVPWLVHYKVVRRKGHDLQNIRYVNRVRMRQNTRTQTDVRCRKARTT